MIGMNYKTMFFSSKAVTSAVDRATRRVFSRFGAFVRRTARSSIRKRKKPSAPGQPPSSHKGLLKRFIFFGYDRTKKSVVIGPVRLTGAGRGKAPSLLEYGGAGTVRVRRRRKRARYKARPFMGPAYEKEKPQLPAMWQGSVN